MGKLGQLCLYLAMAPVLLCGCSGFDAKPAFEEANRSFSQGNYQAALDRYDQIMRNDPKARERGLFEEGVIHAYPKNEGKDYRKALECFQTLVQDYPGSSYRHDSEMMIFYLTSVAVKDGTIADQQKQIEALRQDLESKTGQIDALQKQIETLEQKVFTLATRKGPVDRILIEKKDRRLELISKGEVLKTYRIALGGNPVGPKESANDNKTPEGTYLIDSRNKNSRYHLSLHISYPNDRDKKRARELGVSPGGDIMIHGLKNGFSSVGSAHAEVDWTKGCIAVTDEEIEEIAKVAPNGTVVEIRP